MRQFSDEDLTAFLDGEADANLSEAIESALIEDGVLSQRLADLHLDKDDLKAAFDDLLETAPQAPMMNNPEPVVLTPRFGWLKIAAAALLALGLGWAIGRTDGSELQEWQDYAAAYHRLYVDETLANSNFSDADLTAQLEVVGAAVGVNLTLEAMNSFEGLELRRSQVLGFSDAKIAHIALQDSKGQPVALCITNLRNSNDLTFAEDLGMQTARWSSGGRSYYLIGGTDQELIKNAAKHFSDL